MAPTEQPPTKRPCLNDRRAGEVLQPTLHPAYTDTGAVLALHRTMNSADPPIVDWTEPLTGARCLSQPFPVLQLPRFFSPPDEPASSAFSAQLQNELAALPLTHRSNDLFDFHQSMDSRALSGPCMTGLREAMLSPPVLSLIETLLSVTDLQTDRVDMAAQRYDCGGYLLCHDDDIKEEVEAGVARRVAFVYYLVDETWSEADGGALALFDTSAGQPCGVTERLLPQHGALVLFRVGETSWHQVEEVRTQVAGRARWSVTGWLYGPLQQQQQSAQTTVAMAVPLDVPRFDALTTTEPLEDWLCGEYLSETAVQRIQEQFAEESMIQLRGFLRNDKRAALANALVKLQQSAAGHTELKHAVAAFLPHGPPSHCRYAVYNEHFTNQYRGNTELAAAAALLDRFNAFMRSQTLAAHLEHITQLAIGTVPDSAVYGELRHIAHGAYTLLRDDWREPVGLDAVFHLLASPPEANATPNADTSVAWPEPIEVWQGAYHYVNSDDGELLATLTPTDNALTLVYRDNGVLRFLKHSLQDDAAVTRLDALFTYAVQLDDAEEDA